MAEPAGAQGQSGPPARTSSELGAITPAQARQALDVLQDDAKRARFIDTLQVIVKGAPQATVTPSASPVLPAPSGTSDTTAPAPKEPAQGTGTDSDNLGFQLLVQLSDWLSDAAGQLATAARTVADIPMVWRWLSWMADDPATRNVLFDALWKLALVLACALSVEWVVHRIVRRPIAAVARWVPARARHEDKGYLAPVPPPDSPQSVVSEARKRRLFLSYAWLLLLRLPFVLIRLTLDLLPVISVAVIGNMLLSTELGAEPTPRLIILGIVNAYVVCRSVMCVTKALFSPSECQPSLFLISDETAAYVIIWVRRIVVVVVFGIAIASVARRLGLYFPAYRAIVRLVVLTGHLFIVIIILQCRRQVAELIRAPIGRRGALVMARNRLADFWHYLAIALNLALWAVWAFRIKNGYTLLLQYFLATVAVLAIARLISFAIMNGLDRLFRISPDFVRQYPGLEARANRYLPALRSSISGLLVAITIVALLEVWGIDAVAWFSESAVGGRLVSAVITVAIAVIAALSIWEASNAAIERHLAQLTRDGHYARSARLRTFLPMLRTSLMSAILTVVLLTTLSQLGVNIAPLLAGAGIVGIAVGFGAQKLVQDIITGLFLLLENAMQVGDFVTVSGLSGTVENLSIRTIKLRAGDGSVHIIPFSSVTSVTNTNRGIGNASISVSIDYKEDTDQVSAVLKDIAAEMRNDPKYKFRMRGDLDLWGVDKVDATMATIVGQIECTDSGRWPVQREFYRRMKQRFQELGIEIARPSQTTILLQQLPAPPAGEELAADDPRAAAPEKAEQQPEKPVADKPVAEAPTAEKAKPERSKAGKTTVDA